MKSVIFIAPPAGGKGTFSNMICSKYNIPHISTGDLLREATYKDNEMGSYIKEQMQLGNLINDEIIFELIEKRIVEDDCKNGYVLDGFPRSIEQAITYEELLLSLNKDLGCVILLDTPKEIASKRISGRLSCPKCGKVYNSFFNEMKPKYENICDDCKVSLIKREDDNEKTYELRYNTYIEKTQPLINYYKSKNLLYVVNSTLSPEEVLKQIEDIIRGE